MKKKNKIWLTVLPLYLSAIFLVLIPLLYIVILSFLKKDAVWGVTNEFTLNNFIKIFDPIYLKTFVDSLMLAFLTTIITLFLGYPFGYFMAKLTPKKRSIIMLLVVIPFWTNALVRIYGWIILLRTNGIINNILLNLGLIDEPIKILYTYGAVLIGMVYSLLPFMILSVYTSAEKLDWSLIEAARDLGANRFQAFLTITLKLTLPGILSGVVLVFIPSVGLFFISDLLGGGKIMLLGNLIKNQLLVSRDLPFGAALSLIMMLMTLIIIGIYAKVSHSKDSEGMV